MIKVAAIHTVFDKEDLFSAIAELYDIGVPLVSRFVSNGLNDTYDVVTDKGRYVLRVYKRHWRDEAAIRYELDLLLYLNDCGIPLSYPIARKDGELLTYLAASEGTRYAALFTYAEGVGKADINTSVRYGRAVAQLHHASNGFVPSHDRFDLDSVHLLDEPLAHLLPKLQHRPDDARFVLETADRLKQRMNQLSPNNNDWGVCHGDLHGWNVFHEEESGLTHFDFDCCGAGWRAYDLSVYLWNFVHGRHDPEKFGDECWEAFLGAYLSERPLGQSDLDAIPSFVAIRQLWLLGLHTGNSAVWGAWQDDNYFDGKLKFLKLWMEAYDL
ncbi:phosphotransferase [Paenibacillus harenae]|uniref:Ser/Thr protein kinase RdoA (MazF antagonist) n=1 Tax=Paenibacillus harenae TaxID=306543 RepID=A0ABT9TWS0_PAEHA|nr:phosphotransferase [Paenibacillus harenae]MDQ0111173.1 Ser/Thr protein kinase RdoA (MazF antagonist) [Paenibacillus harenae]